MVKRIFFCLVWLLIGGITNAQNTYYWIGSNVKTDALLIGADWNTQQDGLGIARNTANVNDILIVDGSKEIEIDVAGMSNPNIKRFEISAGANVTIKNNGTSVVSFTLNGESSSPVLKGLSVSGGSVLKIVSKNTGAMNLQLARGGDVVGSTVYIIGDAYDNNGETNYRSSRLQKTGSLIERLTFSAGSSAYISSAASAFGSSGTNMTNSVVFEAGTNLYFLLGNSPFSNANGEPVINLKKGSNFFVRAISTNSNFFNNRSFGNLIIENGIEYIGGASNNFGSVDNLTVRENSKLILSPNVSAFTSKVSGNIYVETGSEFAVTANSNGQTTLEMNGDGTLQTINGAVSSLNMFKVSLGASVKLNTNLTIAAARDIFIEGTLDLNNHVLSGLGKFNTVSGATLVSEHTGGLKANITTSGNQNYAQGTNYIFNVATETSFPEEATSVTFNAVANVIFNAAASINRPINVSGSLTLNGNKLTISNNASITMLEGAVFSGTYNDNAYIVALNNGCVCSSGTIFVEGITSTMVIPVGTASDYIPVMVEASVPSNFSVNVFGNVTLDATPDGIPVADKTNLVNATWKLSRTSGNGTFNVMVNWPNALEGVGFSGLTNNQIGIARLNGLTYDNFRGIGNNTANTVKINNLTQNGPIIVGGVGTVLPVSLVAFGAQRQGSTVNLKWTTVYEHNSSHFNIERSSNGENFNLIGTKKASGDSYQKQEYVFADFNPINGVNYYRLVQYDKDGKTNTYEPISVSIDPTSSFTLLASKNSREIEFRLLSDKKGQAQLDLYNMEGKKVVSQKLEISSGSNIYTMSTSELYKGIYILQYQLDEDIYIKKFLK